MIASVRNQIEEEGPAECQGDGCTDSDFSYRPDFGVYACEGCYEKAVIDFMSHFE